jgi:hypothetical protein
MGRAGRSGWRGGCSGKVMHYKRPFVSIVPIILATLGCAIVVIAQQGDKFALAEDDVKQLLLLMDTDKNGKVSKQEYMSFMSGEFDRLDKDKSGELDPKELAQSRLRVSHTFTSVGK